MDTDKIPGDLLRAYYAVELKALSKNNPSGFASARQKREAKEIARDRLEAGGEGRPLPQAEVHPGAVGPALERGAVRRDVADAGRSAVQPVRADVRAELECITAGRAGVSPRRTPLTDAHGR